VVGYIRAIGMLSRVKIISIERRYDYRQLQSRRLTTKMQAEIMSDELILTSVKAVLRRPTSVDVEDADELDR